MAARSVSIASVAGLALEVTSGAGSVRPAVLIALGGFYAQNVELAAAVQVAPATKGGVTNG